MLVARGVQTGRKTVMPRGANGLGSLIAPQVRCAAVLAALLVLSSPGYSQVLTVEPSCGIKGSTLTIGGSGWAEPVPVCEYIFFFGGVEFTPRQPDGLFGPPNMGAVIPDVVVGEYIVKVELRLLDEGATLIQCRQVKFKVLDAVEDPWDSGISTPGNNSIDLKFDPANVCDITPCSKIVFVQTIKMTGQKSDGTVRNLTFAEQGWSKSVPLDADVTNAGWTVDYVTGEKDPYYNGDDGGDIGTQGLQNGTPKTATMNDGPTRGDGSYPADIVKIILDFEVAAYCAAGQNKSEYLGTTTWKWERPKGGTITVTKTAGSRSAPSKNFTDALSKWGANHTFSLPTMSPATSGGEGCS